MTYEEQQALFGAARVVKEQAAALPPDSEWRRCMEDVARIWSDALAGYDAHLQLVGGGKD
jgi:hypothetical protein